MIIFIQQLKNLPNPLLQLHLLKEREEKIRIIENMN